MTDAEAMNLLQILTEHYREPVMPVSRYCAALKTWRECIERLAQPREGHVGAMGQPYDSQHEWVKKYLPFLQQIETDIRKSNLLYRLIYCGETLRTVPCPSDHARHWSGPAMMNGCPHGCGGTGWLP